VAFCKKKCNKLWILKAYDRQSKRTIAFVTGRRDIATVQKLYDQIKHLTNCLFYTDDWNAFKKVLPSDRHIIGKQHTHLIESDNANLRHYLGRFTRKTKIVSQSNQAVCNSIKLWLYAHFEFSHSHLFNSFLSLFD